MPIYEAGEHDGQLYLAMRYVEGSDLSTVLQTEGKLAPDEALWIVGQVAAALDQAHSRGLVHRDVKPANVLLDPNEHAYLSDFGISTQMGGAAADSGHTGTLDYLAPEQIRGEAVDARSDCYSLACILYECLAGEPPFRRQTEAETLWAHLQSEPAPLSSYPALEHVFRKGLAKEKDERYESCGAMIEAAAAALGLATPAALRRRPVGPARVRRRRANTVAGAAVLAGAIAAVTGGGDPDRQPPGNTLVSIDAATGKFIEQVPVGATPTDVAVGGGAAWSFSGDEKTVSRVDMSSGGGSNALRRAPPDRDRSRRRLAVGGPSGRPGREVRLDRRGHLPRGAHDVRRRVRRRGGDDSAARAGDAQLQHPAGQPAGGRQRRRLGARPPGLGLPAG
ncbi:MAG: protein kinase [Thermoleophilaceae bacterium]